MPFSRNNRIAPFIAGLVVIALFFGALYCHALKNARGEALRLLSSTTELQAEALEGWLGSRMEIVDILRSTIENSVPDGEVPHDLLRPSVLEGKARNTFVISIDGTFSDRSYSPVHPGFDAKSWAADFLDGASPGDPPRLGPVRLSPVTGLPAFYITAPLHRSDGEVRGVVGVSYPLEVLPFFTDSQGFPGRRYCVFTAEKEILSPANAAGQPLQLKDVPGMMQVHAASLGADSGSVETVVDGKAHVFVFFRIRGTDWVFAAHVPKEQVYKGLSPLQNLFLAFFLVTLLGTGFLLYRSRQHDSYKNLSESDLLTEAGNRLALDRAFKSLRRKGDYPIAMLMCDMDNLKVINDSLGHEQGDVQIKRMAAALRRSLRVSDEIFRLGGDEFAVILPGTGRRTAELLVARTMRVVQEVSNSSLVLPPLSMSIGVAVAESAGEIDSLYGRADGAMYKTKEAGREAAARRLTSWLEHHGAARKHADNNEPAS